MEHWTLQGWRCSECGDLARDVDVECPHECHANRALEVVEVVPAEQLRGAVSDLEALRAVLSDVSAFPNRGARVQRAREMVVDLLNQLRGQ